MIFTDPTNKQGLIEDITFLTGVDLQKYKIGDRTRAINDWCLKVWTWIFEAYGGWQLTDDEATISLVSGTDTYGIPSQSLTIKQVDVLRSDGTTWDTLIPLTLDEIPRAEGEFEKTDGMPKYYRPIADEIKLYPAPNYSVTNGLKLFIDAELSTFTVTSTNSAPGFASLFHRIPSVGASLEYAMVNGPANKVTSLSNLIADYEKRLKRFYAKRWKDKFPARAKVVDSVKQYK